MNGPYASAVSKKRHSLIMGTADEIDAELGVDRVAVVGVRPMQPSPIAETSKVPRSRFSMVYVLSAHHMLFRCGVVGAGLLVVLTG